MDFTQIKAQANEWIVVYGGKLIAAVLILVIGLWIVGAITRFIKRMMDRRGLDENLRPFLSGIISTILKILVVLSALSTLGVEMTSFVAILGAAGLAVGLALSGTLQNFAGGVLILILKPFSKGDYIEAQGYSGSVNAINIFNTTLKTPDNKTILIPNGPLSTGALTNYSTEARRRVDFVFGIAYGDDVDKARRVLLDLIRQDKRVLTDPEPFIALGELADSSVNLTVRVWAETADYWDIKFDLTEAVYKRFASEGINIPFPQMDVHLQGQG